MSRVIVILLCAVLSSCQLWRVDGMMNEAERQMGCAVDSALTTMRSIKRYAVFTPERRARYGLLYSMALDKTYIDVTSDSLIRYSAEYYDRKGTPHQRMRAYYYLGRTQGNDRQYNKAILSFLDAAQYIDKVDDKFLISQVTYKIGEIYSFHFDYDKAYNYLKIAYDIQKEIDSKYQVLTLSRMGSARLYYPHYREAIKLFRQAIDDAHKYKYYDEYFTTIKNLTATYVCNNNLKSASKMLLWMEEHYQKDRIYYNYFDHGVGAVVYAYLGDKQKADYFMDKAWNLAANKQDSVFMKCFDAYYENLTGRNKDKEIQLRGDATVAVTSLLLQQLTNPIDAGQKEYFEQKYALAQQRDRVRMITYIVFFSVMIVALIILLYYIHMRNKREMERCNTQIAYYADVLGGMKHTIDAQNENMYSLLDEVLNGKFSILNELCQTYYEYADNNQQQIAIFKRVEKLITEIYGSDDSFVAIEDAVNRCRNNILKDAQAEIPSLSADEYKLMCYIYAGFSTQAISLFFECSSSAVYNRVSRLRKKIKSSETPKSEEFLKYLG